MDDNDQHIKKWQVSSWIANNFSRCSASANKTPSCGCGLDVKNHPSYDNCGMRSRLPNFLICLVVKQPNATKNIIPLRIKASKKIDSLTTQLSWMHPSSEMDTLALNPQNW